MIQEQDATLAEPYHAAHAAFKGQDHLTASDPLSQVLRVQIWQIFRRDEVGLNFRDDVEQDDEDGVQALVQRIRKRSFDGPMKGRFTAARTMR